MTFLGRALPSAVLTAVMTAQASGKPGAGSNSEGGNTNTPSVPLNAAARAAASSISACETSQPFSAQDRALPALRTTARAEWPPAKRVRASAPPTLPVIPVIAYMLSFLLLSPALLQRILLVCAPVPNLHVTGLPTSISVSRARGRDAIHSRRD